MENTTRMYIEYVVIGMQVTLLLFFILISLDSSVIGYLKNISSVMEIVIVIPISYSLGIFIDRIYKYLPFFSEKKEKPIKQEACKFVFEDCDPQRAGKEVGKRCKGCERDRISIEVWKHFDEMDYYIETMARKRILRATCVNSFFSVIALVGLWICKKIEFLNFEAKVFLCVILMALSFGCGKIYRKLMEEYYKKQKKFTRLLIIEEKSNENTTSCH